MGLKRKFKRLASNFIRSPIKVDFSEVGGRSIQEVAPYPDEVFWDTSVPIYTTTHGVEYVRTPDDQFLNLPGYNFDPHYLEIDGLRMHYVDVGPKDGELILMLHGQPVWSYLYRKMITDLAARGYRCIAPDLIGMGRSDKPIHEKYHTYDRHCELTLSFIKGLNLQNITIFIQDWGSLIGARLVGENPDLFARLLLANGDLPDLNDTTNPLYVPKTLRVNPKIKSLKVLGKFVLKGMPYSFQAWVLFCLQCTYNFIGELMDEYTVNTLSVGERAAYEAPFPSFIYMAAPRTFPSMNAGLVGQQMQAWDNLKHFNKPLISFIGLKDRLLGKPRIQQKWVAHVPGAKNQLHEQFENANHFIQEDIGNIMADRTHKFIQANPSV